MRFRFYIISQSGIGRCVQIMPAGTVTGDAVQYIHRFCKMAAVDVIGRRIQTERILIVGILSALLISAKTTETAKSSEPAVAGTKSAITLSLALSIAAIPVIRGAAFPLLHNLIIGLLHFLKLSFCLVFVRIIDIGIR